MILDFTLRDVLIVLGAASTCVFLVFYLLWRLVMAQSSFTFNITINPAVTSLVPVVDPLNISGVVGQSLSVDLASNVQGGKPPYTFTVAGTPPDGLSVSGSVISGTPTTPGTSTLSVSVSDAQ